MIQPGATIGIIGTGQLGRMLATAAARLGLRVHTYGPDEDPPAARVAAAHTAAAYEDAGALQAFAKAVDVATFEFENIPPLTIRTLADAGCRVFPDDRVLSVCQDRLAEKTFLRDQGVQTASFFPVNRAADITAALHGLPGGAILKSRRFGYDGKGQYRMTNGADPAVAFEEIGGVPAILEGFVDFDCEVSQVAARKSDGSMAFYDLPRNTHADGILRTSEVPCGLPHHVTAQAQSITRRLMETLEYVGVMTVEFFWSTDKGLIANEIAPRVHNSGHWTVEACHTDQFEQHIRAIAGWPLGDTDRNCDAVMTNLIGDDVERWAELLAKPATAVTLYGKSEIRRGRKMGHWVRTAPVRPWRTGRGVAAD
jgi:5-(carboxyamino)imidazole ribonucleotide synthase